MFTSYNIRFYIMYCMHLEKINLSQSYSKLCNVVSCLIMAKVCTSPLRYFYSSSLHIITESSNTLFIFCDVCFKMYSLLPWLSLNNTRTKIFIRRKSKVNFGIMKKYRDYRWTFSYFPNKSLNNFSFLKTLFSFFHFHS